mmetsp:Transcript_74085/g.171844  ORF Transcript_74085/g.171844 Transcript_74085/m.171844 type:complete len:221 (+) Transcript_74085:390-1052(+)
MMPAGILFKSVFFNALLTAPACPAVRIGPGTSARATVFAPPTLRRLGLPAQPIAPVLLSTLCKPCTPATPPVPKPFAHKPLALASLPLPFRSPLVGPFKSAFPVSGSSPMPIIGAMPMKGRQGMPPIPTSGMQGILPTPMSCMHCIGIIMPHILAAMAAMSATSPTALGGVPASLAGTLAFPRAAAFGVLTPLPPLSSPSSEGVSHLSALVRTTQSGNHG